MSFDNVVSALIDDLSEWDTPTADRHIDRVYSCLQLYYRDKTKENRKKLEQAIKEAKRYLGY